MVDYRVRFVGDLGNLKAFDAAVQNSMGASSRALQQANLRIAQSAGVGKLDIFDPKTSGVGRFANNIKTEIDAVNRTFIHSGDIVRRYISDYKQITDEVGNISFEPVFSDEYLGSFKKVEGNYDVYLDTLKKVQVTEAQIDRARQKYNQTYAASLTKQLELESRIHGLKGGRAAAAENLTTIKDLQPITYANAIRNAEDRLKSTQAQAYTFVPNINTLPGVPLPEDLAKLQGFQYTSVIEGKLRSYREQIDSGKNAVNTILSPQEISELKAKAAVLEGVLRDIPTNLAYTEGLIQKELQTYQTNLAQETAHISREITLLEKQLARLQGLDATGAAKLEARIARLKASNPAYGDLAAATSATPPINAKLQRALDFSPQLRKQLLQGGLGEDQKFGTAGFTEALARQEASVSKFTRNIRTGVITVEGELKRFNDLTKSYDIGEKFTADLDKNGKVITRWGGQLSGAGSILRQTVRDFQKVIEWTIATTAVFGTLGLAISSLKTINDLNTSLTRFSITAQVSVGEAKDIFADLGQVAIDTATPLNDLVKVADDIALATKTAGDSTDEWKAKIIDLTTAVGIFTNLTGEDTVQGADKLSSAFKQLSIAPKDLIGVLNQVTAVAGGQSTAINDIVTALGGVAEAGKAAQLSIGEQIALVQVLGQVTNKSAADTATAFKNLFGAISSPGSEKILKEFGINIRDAQGGLKPFLDIYKEINKAVQDGTIPIQRYQDVLRGISGGPRRAPDAAALLGNLPAVEAAIARAAGASNEALVANAKILDTNQAKIQQLQNAFDIALFQKFGDAVQNATAGVTDFLTSALDLFNKIDPSLVSLVLTVGALAVAAKAVGFAMTKTKIIGLDAWTSISRSIRNAASDLREFIAQETVAAALQSGNLRYNSAGQLINRAGRFANNQDVSTLDIVKGTVRGTVNKGLQSFQNLGFAKGTAAIGATVIGLNALTGALQSNDEAAKQTGGQILQFLGTVGLATGVLTPLSVAAFLAGTALQFMGKDAQQAAESAHDASVSVYDSIQKLKESRATVAEAESAQSDARQKLDAIVATGKKDQETKDAQTQATNAFVEATLKLADANKVASDSFDELLAKIPQLGEKYALFRSISRASSQEDIDKLSQQLAGEILKIQGQGGYRAGPISTTYKQVPLTAPGQIPLDQLSIDQQRTYGQEHNLIPFEREMLRPNRLRELFDLNNGGARTNVDLPVSAQNLSELSSSLQDIISGKAKVDLNQGQIDTLVKAVDEFLAANSSFYEVQTALLSDAARVQALQGIGVLSGEQATNAGNRISAAQALQNYLPNASSQVGGPEDVYSNVVSQEKVLQLIQKLRDGIDSGAKLSNDELKDVALTFLSLNGTLDTLKEKGDQALKVGMADALVQIGFNVDDVAKAFGILPSEIQKSEDELAKLKEIADSFDKARNDALTKYAQRSASLREQQNSGGFDKNSKGLEVLQAQNEAAYNSETKLIDSIQTLNHDALTELQVQLAGVIGLQNATVVSGDQLAAALVDQAVAAGVNAKGIQKIQQEVIKLINLSNVLSRIRTTYNIKVNVDAKGALAILKALLAAQIAFGATHHGPGGAYFQGQSIPGLQSAINELQAAINEAAKSQNTINQILASGQGSTLGQLPSGGTKSSTTKAKQGFDVSNLDLPDEIANASNRDALIKQAIANAKLLQSKIPGASKDAKNDIVELLKGTQRILEVRGIKDDYLRKALEELADIEKKRLDFETKADTIRRIRVGAGDFAAIANVPVNSTSGVSLGSPNGPINVTLNLNGTVLTPAQLAQFADLVASALKRQIANG